MRQRPVAKNINLAIVQQVANLAILKQDAPLWVPVLLLRIVKYNPLKLLFEKAVAVEFWGFYFSVYSSETYRAVKRIPVMSHRFYASCFTRNCENTSYSCQRNTLGSLMVHCWSRRIIIHWWLISKFRNSHYPHCCFLDCYSSIASSRCGYFRCIQTARFFLSPKIKCSPYKEKQDLRKDSFDRETVIEGNVIVQKTSVFEILKTRVIPVLALLEQFQKHGGKGSVLTQSQSTWCRRTIKCFKHWLLLLKRRSSFNREVRTHWNRYNMASINMRQQKLSLCNLESTYSFR